MAESKPQNTQRSSGFRVTYKVATKICSFDIKKSWEKNPITNYVFIGEREGTTICV